MIKLISLSDSKPYELFKDFYEQALALNQPNIEAISISSFDSKKKEVDSRFVNLKYINSEKWIFFTNYNSNKALQFFEHSQISAIVFWHTINLQIRIKADLEKISEEQNQEHFESRSPEKNALAISSNQSRPAESYENIKEKYYRTLDSENLTKCPDYWGGYSFKPYYFEFWEGRPNRLNIRNTYNFNDNNWEHRILEP